MRIQRTYTGAGRTEPVDLADAQAVVAADIVDVEFALLRETFGGTRDGVANAHDVIVRHAGASLHDELRERRVRKLAAAWQALEHAEAICRHPEYAGSYFLLPFGRAVLDSSAGRDELLRAAGRI